ncbi:MAG: pimeloyl-ACP methyl ester carboxylesterase, partial [Oceanicoccus sp.]
MTWNRFLPPIMLVLFSFIGISAAPASERSSSNAAQTDTLISGASIQKHIVMSNGHPMALWGKSVSNPKGQIILHHGRTWSALPDFDLQVPGEELSLMDGFNKMGYSVWALDARGYGGTPRDSSGWNSPDKAAKDLSVVLGWIQRKTSKKTHVWGWSLGAMVTQLTAQKYPENILSIVLFGYPIRPEAPYPEAASREGEMLEIPPQKVNTAKNAASDFIVPNSISQTAIDEYVRHALTADPIRADWNQMYEWRQLDATKVNVPVLLLQAEFDPLANTTVHAQVFPKFTNANKQWVVLAGGDHAALLETPR